MRPIRVSVSVRRCCAATDRSTPDAIWKMRPIPAACAPNGWQQPKRSAKDGGISACWRRPGLPKNYAHPVGYAGSFCLNLRRRCASCVPTTRGHGKHMGFTLCWRKASAAHHSQGEPKTDPCCFLSVNNLFPARFSIDKRAGKAYTVNERYYVMWF